MNRGREWHVRIFPCYLWREKKKIFKFRHAECTRTRTSQWGRCRRPIRRVRNNFAIFRKRVSVDFDFRLFVDGRGVSFHILYCCIFFWEYFTRSLVARSFGRSPFRVKIRDINIIGVSFFYGSTRFRTRTKKLWCTHVQSLAVYRIKSK